MEAEVARKIAEEMTSASFNHIEPVFGGRNSRIFRLKNRKDSFALKFYRTDAKNIRDRFDAETSALNLFAENGLKCVPKLIAQDRENNCILMEWIDGEPVTDFKLKYINPISSFVKKIYGISKQNNSNHIRFATEACLNGNAIVTQIKGRLKRLEPEGSVYPELKKFIDEDFIPAFNKITDWSKEEYLRNSMDFDQDISLEQLTLSPVDIGPHNCLRIENQLYFIDFEFFGWDDPVKLVADTLQHPSGKLDSVEIVQLRRKLQTLFTNDDQFLFRLNCLYSLFGLKWCMIVLNPFQPGYNTNQQNDDDIKKKQLIKAKELIKKMSIMKGIHCA